MSDYRVDLDNFAGPLDLLLYLVRKDEVDIYDIPIARITDQYISYIDLLKNLDIDIAGEFLVMAATLMQIKSAMLLPRVDETEDGEEDLQDPRTELIRQLLEYKKYKDAANILGHAAEQQQNRFVRPNTILQHIKPETEPELDLDQVNVWDLVEAFDRVLKATGNYADYSHITDDTSIDMYQIEILDSLQKAGPQSFERIFQGSQNRAVMVGRFLALLELIRDQLIWAEQAKSTIYLRALTDVPAPQAVQDAILSHEDQQDPPAENTIPIVETPANKTEQPTTQPAEYEEY